MSVGTYDKQWYSVNNPVRMSLIYVILKHLNGKCEDSDISANQVWPAEVYQYLFFLYYAKKKLVARVYSQMQVLL